MAAAFQETDEQQQRDVLRDALQPGDDRENAALVYMRAFDELIQLGDGFQDDWMRIMEHIEEQPGPASYQTREVADLLERGSRALQLAHEASALDYADFGPNVEDGYMTLVPHLAPMRELSRLLSLESNMRRANGESTSSADSLAALMNLSRHSASDGMVINSLVGLSCAQQGFDSIEDAIARGDLDQASAKIALGGFDAKNPDPFQFARSMGSELESLEATMLSLNYDAAEFAEMFGTFTDGEKNGTIELIRNLDEEEFAEQLELARPGFELAQTAFLEEDPEKAKKAIAELEEDLLAGEYGLLAEIVMPSYDLLLDRKIQADNQIRRYTSILEKIAGGADPANFANAAVLYEQAFPYLARITKSDQELLDMIRKIVAVTGSCDDIPDAMLDEARGALEQAAPIIGILRGAAKFERCEWKADIVAERRGEVIPFGEWVRPMRAAIRLLLAEAAMISCLDEDDVEEDSSDLIRSLADAFAVSVHLGDGSHLAGSVASAAAATELMELARAVLPGRSCSVESRDLLDRRLARIAGNDPLGWSAAREATLRPPFFRVIMGFGLRNPIDAERLARNWNTERLAAIAFLAAARKVDEETPARPSFPGDDGLGELFGISDIIELDDKETALLGTPRTRLIELLEVVDRIEPIRTNHWQSRGNDSLAELAELVGKLHVDDPVDTDSAVR